MYMNIHEQMFSPSPVQDIETHKEKQLNYYNKKVGHGFMWGRIFCAFCINEVDGHGVCGVGYSVVTAKYITVLMK